jgi:hypothetical protein
MRSPVCLCLAAGLLMAAVAQDASAVTDRDVVKAIEKGQKWLMNQQGGNGSWPEKKWYHATGNYGHTEIALFTLVYTGVHPNRPVIENGLKTLLARNLDYTYAISMRLMAYAYIQRKFSDRKRDAVRKAMKLDALWLCQAQGSHGGWDYKSLGGSGGRYDLSNTQMAILALREAALAGCEIPDIVWQRAQGLYFRLQQRDGSWNYGEHNAGRGKDKPGYGSMTAAGLASIFITMDNLNLASGCPCRGGRSKRAGDEFDRRVDAALQWLEKHFNPRKNPKDPAGHYHFYWLYSVERVGIAAGYKYFGTHNWFQEGAAHLVKAQNGNGSWGQLHETCFAILFLYKGRAPVLYNKLEFEGIWNAHRRDIANLTGYIQNIKEQMFHWQIVSLKAPVAELHDAPVLFITAESVPEFSDAHKKKLRRFTDTGGTILFEASCGNSKVREWAREFFQELWPEWPLKPLGPEHGSFRDPHELHQRPEIFGKHDGMRTFLFYAMDDISCPWQTKALAGRKYLFDWGINLFTYATDRSPLRAKLAKRLPDEEDRYTAGVRAGEKGSLSVVRVKYDDPGWLTNRNYGCWNRVKEYVSQRAKVNLSVNEEGTAPADLGEADVAYLTGPGEIPLAADQQQALKAYLAKGGFLWAEAAGGNPAFAGAIRKLCVDLGLKFKRIPQTEPILNGRFSGDAKGYSLISGVQFQRSLRVSRLGQKHADLIGLYDGDKLVGIFSMFDILFSTTGYNAYACRGYKAQDAKALATNVILYLTAR